MVMLYRSVSVFAIARVCHSLVAALRIAMLTPATAILSVAVALRVTLSPSDTADSGLVGHNRQNCIERRCHGDVRRIRLTTI